MSDTINGLLKINNLPTQNDSSVNSLAQPMAYPDMPKEGASYLDALVEALKGPHGDTILQMLLGPQMGLDKTPQDPRSPRELGTDTYKPHQIPYQAQPKGDDFNRILMQLMGIGWTRNT